MKELTIQDVEMMGSDSQVVFGGTFEGGIHLQQVLDEIVPCINDIIKDGLTIKNFLEIGSAAGGCSVLFDSVFDLDNIIIIDDNNHFKHKFRPENIKKIKAIVKEFIGQSQSEQAISFIKKLNLKFDIIFIDADHSFDAVISDIRNYSPFLADDGFIILHDIEIISSVKEAFEAVSNSGEFKSKSYLSKTHRPCGIGVLKRG